MDGPSVSTPPSMPKLIPELEVRLVSSFLLTACENKKSINGEDKNGYLTGSFDSDSSELKIAFYDQGIGIPRSLPVSELREKVVQFIAKFSNSEKITFDVAGG